MTQTEFIVCVNNEEWFKERTKEQAYERASKVRALNEKVDVSIRVRFISEIEITL